MAVLDMELQFQINKAIQIINALPSDEKYAIEIYIENIRSCLQRERKRNDEYQAVFDAIRKFTSY